MCIRDRDGYPYSKDSQAHFGGEGLVSTMSDFSKFCEMLVNDGNYNGEKIVSSDGIKIMTGKYSNAYPDPSEPNAFPFLEGYYYGFTFSVLENTEAYGSGAPNGIYGWSGYHNTHFWIDNQKNLFGLFMTRAREYNQDIQNDFREAVYSIY